MKQAVVIPRRAAATGVLPALGLAWAALGCGEARELREWRPSDHSQPPAGELDPRSADDPSARGTSEETAVAAAWTVLCQSCHGPEGRGDGPGRPPGAQVRDLGDRDWQASVTDAQIAEVIRNGRGMMPRFGEDRMNDRGVAGLVRYVRALARE